MYSRNSFGSFYPVNSVIHKLNPIVKLILFLVAMFLIISTNSLYMHLFLLAVIIVMMLLSYVPIRYYTKTIWFFRYIYILIAFVSAYLGNSLELTISYMLKIIIFVEYLNVLTFTTSPSETIYAIEKIISPFNFLFLPLPQIAFKINSLLRYIPNIQDVQHKVLKAASSRGVDYYYSNIFGRLFALDNSLSGVFALVTRKNNETLLSLRLRGYNERKQRTNYRTNKIGFYDIIFILFHILLVVALLKESGII